MHNPTSNKRGERRIAYMQGDKIELNDGGLPFTPLVTMREQSVDVGCTTVSRAVVERLSYLFNVHFPQERNPEVKIQ